jgi:hypothetical protein
MGVYNMILNNKKPNAFTISNFEIGYSRVKILHSVPVDNDYSHRSVWVKKSTDPKSSATRIDVAGNEGSTYIGGLDTGTSYDFALAFVDEFVSGNDALLDAQYLQEATVLDIVEHTNVITKTPATISNITSISSDSAAIGSPPTAAVFLISGDSNLAKIEMSDDDWSTYTTVFTGAVADGDEIVLTIPAGTHKFRIRSSFVFSDGSVDDGGVTEYGGEITTTNNTTPPTAVTDLNITAYKVESNVASYNMKVSWNWDRGTDGSHRV